MHIGDAKQFWSGLLFLAIGILALWTLPMPLGTLAAMGPGYFPMLLGCGLILIGIAAMILGVRMTAAKPVARFPVLPTCFVLGGVLALGAVIADAGLAVSLFLLVGASCYARLLHRPLEVLAIYLLLLPVTWFIFIDMIQLPISLLWGA